MHFTKQSTTRLVIGVIGLICFFWLGSALPRTTNTLFASPDETAVFQFARQWTVEHGFKVPHGLPESLQDIASLHPRSVVRQGEWLVPVGFLGMPIIAAVTERILAGSSPFLTLMLVASSIFPLWKLVERYNKRIAFVSVAVYLTFPTVLLYVNRGLFPNLPVVALGLWAVWLARAQSLIKRPYDLRTTSHILFSGLCLGLALIIRPTEALWLLPWMVWALFAEEKSVAAWPRAGMVTATATIVGVFAAMIAYQTYGAFTAGYWLRDDAGMASIVPQLSVTVPGTSSVLPFGIHPRTAWNNIHTYVVGLFGPWVAAAALGIALSLKRGWKREGVLFAVTEVWTAGVLLLLYGQAQYADNIRGTATIGNSFVRYLLPLVPFMAFCVGLFVERLMAIVHRGRLMTIVCTVFLCGMGITTAYTKDEEGILRTKYELSRYEEIHTTARTMLPAGSVIVSERSDKIFAGLPVIAVAPIPERAILERLVTSERMVALFHRNILSIEDAPAETFDFLDVFFTPLVSVDNESLYVLTAEFLNQHE